MVKIHAALGVAAFPDLTDTRTPFILITLPQPAVVVNRGQG